MDNYIEFPDHEFEKRNEEILEKQYEEYEGILQEKLASLFWTERFSDNNKGKIRVKWS